MTFLGEGDLAGARGVLRALPKDTDPTAVAVLMALSGDLYWVLDDAQQRLLLSLSPAPFGDDRSLWGDRKSTRLNSRSQSNLVCRLLLEKQNTTDSRRCRP